MPSSWHSSRQKAKMDLTGGSAGKACAGSTGGVRVLNLKPPYEMGANRGVLAGA